MPPTFLCYRSLGAVAALSLAATLGCSDLTSVRPARVTLALASPTEEVGIGDTLMLIATVTQQRRAIDAPVTVRSLTRSTAVVLPGPSPRILILGSGRALIVASAGGGADTLELTTERLVRVVGFADGRGRDSLVLGTAATLVALGADDGLVAWSAVNFRSSDTTVLAIDERGDVTTRGFGVATLSATQGARSAARAVRVVPEQLLSFFTIREIAAGTRHACVHIFVPNDVGDGPYVRCWGTEISGRGSLGRGVVGPLNVIDGVPEAVAAPEPLRDIRVAADHGCGLGASTGNAYCWGSNTHAELGLGTRSVPPVEGISRAAPIPGVQRFSRVQPRFGNGTCALTASGAAWCWGANDSYQTGRGPRSAVAAGVAPVPNAPAFADIAGGSMHTCGLSGAGIAYCWGMSARVGPGRDDSTYTPAPVAVSGAPAFASIAMTAAAACGRTPTGEAWCWSASTPAPTRFAPSLLFTKLSATSVDMCGLTLAGAVYCWSPASAAGSAPRLEIATTPLRDVAVGDEVVVGVTKEGRLVRWSR